MDLDLTTLLVVSALATVVTAAVFATTSALRHNDEANRLWTAGFASAVTVCALAAIWGLDSETPTAVAAALDVSMVLAVGTIWSGARRFDGRRRSLVLVPLLAAIAAAVPALLTSGTPDLERSAVVRLGLTGVLAWIAAIELSRGKMRQNLNSRILQVGLYVLGGWYAVAAALNAAANSGSRTTPPGTEWIILPFAGLFLVAAVCLSALRVERTGNWWSMSEEAQRRTHLEVLGPEALLHDGRDRLERATLTGSHVAFVLVEINDLSDLNSAFGRGAGDGALVHVSQILRARVPASALIGHLGAGRFVVMSIARATDDAATIISAIRTGLIDTAVGANMQLRSDATFGTSHTIDTESTFEALLAKASVDLDRARS